LHAWAAGRPVLNAASLPTDLSPTDLALDHADQISEPRTLLHLLNSWAEAGCSLVLAGRTPPARWNSGLPDLDSRLRALVAVAIRPPEDSLLKALLRQLLAERQLAVPQALQDSLRLRLPRTAQAMREAASAIDASSLAAGRRVTRGLISQVLLHLGYDEDSSTSGVHHLAAGTDFSLD